MKDEMNLRVLFVTGVIGALLVLVIAVSVQAVYLYSVDAEQARKDDTSQNTWLNDLRAQQKTNITTYHWVDKQKNIAAIPIDQAMSELVQSKGNVATALAR